MNYDTALWMLKAARERAKLLPGWYDILNAPLDVPQRLTSGYGSERVTGGKPYENPVIVALTRSERARKDARSEIAFTFKLFRLCRRALARIPETDRSLLSAYYLEAKTVRQICDLHQWTRKQFTTAKRCALNKLHRKLK